MKTINQFDKMQKQTIELSCLNVVIQYKKHMSGADVLDSNTGQYKNKMQ